MHIPRTVRFFMLIAVVTSSIFLPSAHADDYFLDGSQKLELIKTGRITGRDGAQYDIWIVPGYVLPARQVKAGWTSAGRDLQRYGQADLYREMVKDSRSGMRFAASDMVGDFALKGSARSWSSSFLTAKARVERRVFGWWFAYPWAVIEASTVTVVRAGLGLPSGAAVLVASPVVVPAVYIASPAVKAVAHAGVQGTVFPVVAASWNTAIAPPLALTGQQPAASRADGFWMKRLKDPAEDDIRQRLAVWIQTLNAQPALAELTAQHALKQQAHDAAEKELFRAQTAMREEWKKIRDDYDAKRRETLTALLAQQLPALRQQLQGAGYSEARLRQQRDVLLKTFTEQGMTQAEAQRALNALLGFPDVLEQRAADKKTDPLQSVLDIP